MNENYELEWLKADKKRQQERDLKTEEQLKNVKSFDEIFEREFLKAAKIAKVKNQLSLFDYFIREDSIHAFPETAIYKDIIEREQMLKDIFLSEVKALGVNVYKLLKDAPLTYKKNFIDVFNIKINANILFVFTNTRNRLRPSTYLMALDTFHYSVQSYSTHFNQDILWTNNKKVAANIKKFYGEKQDEISIVKRQESKLKLNNLSEKIKKEILKQIKALEKNEQRKVPQAYVTSIKIQKLNIEKHTYPIYEIRCNNKGVDYKAIICASNKKLVAFYK